MKEIMVVGGVDLPEAQAAPEDFADHLVDQVDLAVDLPASILSRCSKLRMRTRMES